MIAFLHIIGILGAIWLVGFIYFFFLCLFENDKSGEGPTWAKFWFGLIVGFFWPLWGMVFMIRGDNKSGPS